MPDLCIADSPLGLHRALDPPGVLPQVAERLDAVSPLRPSEVRIRVERLNLDAASYRQLRQSHGNDPDALRRAVLEVVARRGKMHNPVTGSGGMLIGVVEEVGRDSPLDLSVGDRVASLVSLTLTPLRIDDGLVRWDGRTEQVPCDGRAILFARSCAAVLPEDLPPEVCIAVLDVCGAGALVAREVSRRIAAGESPTVIVIGAAGKSGALTLAAARRAGARELVGVVLEPADVVALEAANLADRVVRADARDPVGVLDAVGRQGDVTVLCTNVPGGEGAAILTTRDGGTVIFFSMATSFTAATLIAEGVAADVQLVMGNGYVPGHAELALNLVRTVPGLRVLLERHIRGTEAD